MLEEALQRLCCALHLAFHPVSICHAVGRREVLGYAQYLVAMRVDRRLWLCDTDTMISDVGRSYRGMRSKIRRWRPRIVFMGAKDVNWSAAAAPKRSVDGEHWWRRATRPAHSQHGQSHA
jgi:hypothetical protein